MPKSKKRKGVANKQHKQKQHQKMMNDHYMKMVERKVSEALKNKDNNIKEKKKEYTKQIIDSSNSSKLLV